MINAYCVLTSVRGGRVSPPPPVNMRAFMEGLKEAAGPKYDRGVRQALYHAAKIAKETIVEYAAREMRPPTKPLSPSTAARKGHYGWLYDEGKLVNDLQPKVVRIPGADFAVALVLPGDLPTSRNNGGKMNYARLAQVLIYGAVIHITDPEKVARVIGWLKGQGILGMGENLPAKEEWKGGLTIVIPPRGDLIPPYVKNAVSQRVRKYLMSYFSRRFRRGMQVISVGGWDGSLPSRVRVATQSVLPEKGEA